MNGQPSARRDWSKHSIVWVLLAIQFLPLYMMVQVSLKDNAAFLQHPWLPSWPQDWQWQNWAFAIRLVLPYLANTILVSVTATVATLILGLLGAYFFARHRIPGHRLLWIVFMVLMMLPNVANIVPLFSLLKSMSLLNTLWALIAVGTASAQAFTLLVLRSFIEEIPRGLFEAAEMDGATHFQQIVHVVVPLAGSILGTLAIITFLDRWNDFLLPLVVLQDPSKFTLGVGLIYLDGEYVKHWGQIMAAYLFAAVPLVLLFLFTMKLFVQGLSSGAIKG